MKLLEYQSDTVARNQVDSQVSGGWIFLVDFEYSVWALKETVTFYIYKMQNNNH